MNKTFSFVIPVYNRPEEIKELLESLCDQDTEVFEVLVIEDGSTITSEAVVASFKNRLPISYFFKPNSGPGASRNFGMIRAKGDYFIILDSDCVLPVGYLSAVKSFFYPFIKWIFLVALMLQIILFLHCKKQLISP